MNSPAKILVSDRATLAARIAAARKLTDDLFPLLRPGAVYDRPIAERHRLIFYLGHLEAFDWNLIGQASGLESFDVRLDRLFAFGIDPVGGGLPTDQPSDWPSENEVRGYNAQLRARLDRLLPEADSTLLHVAVEHRLMHAETLAYLLHQLPLDRKIVQPQVRARVTAKLAQDPRVTEVPAGVVTLGQARRECAFGWDNEFEEQRLPVDAFRTDVFPVTNAQFVKFVSAGGYDDPALWKTQDWEWKNAAGLAHPGFWQRRGGEWYLRTMFAEIPLPSDWPVFVSHAEASAYAQWAGRKLPTEAQWHRMAYGTAEPDERAYPWGSEPPTPEHGNFDFTHWDPTPVQAHPRGVSAFGVEDLLGNGWEWTSTPFAPLQGFQPFSFYRGYSSDFFDGKHFVMKGGSPRTAATLLRRSFRNWFQPHYPYVYAKFRCVED